MAESLDAVFAPCRGGQPAPVSDESSVVFHLGTHPQTSNNQARKNSNKSRKYPVVYGNLPSNDGSWLELR